MSRACVALAIVLAFGLGAASSSCTPKDREALAPAIAPAIKAGCVLLRALFKDGTASDLCVTAEDLAPLVSEIIAEREERGPETVPAGPVVAFAIKEEAKPRLAPKRRCAAWVNVPSSKDAGRGSGIATTYDHEDREGGAADGGR